MTSSSLQTDQQGLSPLRRDCPRCALFVLALLACALLHAQRLDYATTPQDSAFAVRVLGSLEPEQSTAQNMLLAGNMLLGQPYVAGTLDELERETTCLYLTRTDCILFVETCLNLARTARCRGNFLDFALMVQHSRYRHGQPSDYMERLHYTTEWIRHNEARGILKDVTLECGGRVYGHPINYMSSHPGSYPKMDGSVTQIEAGLNSIPFTYIPKSDVAKASLKPGDIICFVTSIEGLDIQHVALYVGDGRFMHASTARKMVTIDERTVSEYCYAGRTIAGIKVVRATDTFVPGDKVKYDDKYFTVRPIPDHIFSLMQGRSFKPDCTLSRDDLRYLTVLHRNASGDTRIGEMVVSADIAWDVLDIFRNLYAQSYPIEKMRLVDYYNADDDLSMADNNSSAFNWRKIAGSSSLSKHSLGVAIDINPLYNPHVKNGGADNRGHSPYVIRKGDACHRLFLEKGFSWGGSWKSSKDYQHFEK